MVSNRIKEKAISQFTKNMDANKINAFIKQVDKNFVTLSQNQITMQENQIEFEAYLKDIQKKLNQVLVELSNIEKLNTKKDINIQNWLMDNFGNMDGVELIIKEWSKQHEN